MPIMSAPLLVRVKSFGFKSTSASIGMWCMCSRPPTICTSSAPARIACDACASACKLLPQRRLTVAPAASTGSPAIKPTARATLKPCSRCCCVLPSTTSSMAAGSMPLRSTIARTTATARSSERTSRKTPFSACARPIGVRQQSTTTAVFIVSIVEASARLGDFGEQFCWFEAFAQRGVRLEFFEDCVRAELIGPEEEAAFEGWKSDAEDERKVDVAGVADEAVFEHAGGFAQHRQEKTGAG